MTAKHTKLSFLHTFDTVLERRVLNQTVQQRREFFFECVGRINMELAAEPDVSLALLVLRDPTKVTMESINAINLASAKWLGQSIEFEENGDEEASVKGDRIGAILASIATFLEHPELSARDLDQCLYYLDFVLMEPPPLK